MNVVFTLPVLSGAGAQLTVCLLLFWFKSVAQKISPQEETQCLIVFDSSIVQIFEIKMDKYAVLDLIGEGSFGRVFRGKDKQSGEIVALKLIPKVGHTDKDIKSLRCECKIQKELKHPNIVRMIDAFETDNEVISVAEYVPGELFRLFDQYKAGMYLLDYEDYTLKID